MSTHILATEEFVRSRQPLRYDMSSQAGLATLRGPIRLTVTDDELADEAALQPKGHRS